MINNKKSISWNKQIRPGIHGPFKDLDRRCMTIFGGTSVTVRTVHGFLDSTVS